MSLRTKMFAACLIVAGGATAVQAANTFPTNPMGLAYNLPVNSGQYGHPGGMVVTGVCNRYDATFATARANGAEVLAYLDPVEVSFAPAVNCALNNAFYDGGASNVPLWPYNSYGVRSNYPESKLADIRAGSAWSNQVVAYLEGLMRENKVDGVFLDVIGARLWTSLAAWDTWAQWEKDAWTDGAVDLMRRLDASRRAINPNFIIVNNNNWDRGDARGFAAEKYIDGVVLEHKVPTSAYQVAYAGRTFSNLGHRRVLVIAKTTADAQTWAQIQGVTNVSNQARYLSVTAPPIPFNRVTDRPVIFGRTSVGAYASSGMGANFKRGSKFEMTEKGTLLNLTAYLDGAGGPSGSQAMRMSLYTDNGGVPGTLVAESQQVSIAANMSAHWVAFPTSAIALNPGSYWIVMHTSSTTAISRNRGDGLPNWYGATESYAGGVTKTFGSGEAGTVTLSVFASYSRGQ